MNQPTWYECLSAEKLASVREMRKAANYTYRKCGWSVDKTFYWQRIAWKGIAL